MLLLYCPVSSLGVERENTIVFLLESRAVREKVVYLEAWIELKIFWQVQKLLYTVCMYVACVLNGLRGILFSYYQFTYCYIDSCCGSSTKNGWIKEIHVFFFFLHVLKGHQSGDILCKKFQCYCSRETAKERYCCQHFLWHTSYQKREWQGFFSFFLQKLRCINRAMTLLIVKICFLSKPLCSKYKNHIASVYKKTSYKCKL